MKGPWFSSSFGSLAFIYEWLKRAKTEPETGTFYIFIRGKYDAPSKTNMTSWWFSPLFLTGDTSTHSWLSFRCHPFVFRGVPWMIWDMSNHKNLHLSCYCACFASDLNAGQRCVDVANGPRPWPKPWTNQGILRGRGQVDAEWLWDI